MEATHERVAAIADRIEAELRRLGRWSAEPIDPARLVDMGAFGRNTLAAEEWIQHVLVERIRALVASGAALPRDSQTAVWATREFDGDGDADVLLDLLGELDALAQDSGKPERPAVLATIDRVIALCQTLPMVKAAYVVQLYAPHADQLTSPALGLDLTAPLPPGAFAGWPASEALVVFGLGDDAISRLARLTPPVYTLS